MASGSLVKRGNSWRVMVYAGRDPVTGRKRQVTRTVQGTRKEAEAVRNEMLVAVAQGKTSTTSMTFGELLDAWFEANQADWSPRTALEHRRIIDAVLKPALGAKKLARLRASDLDALYARLRDGGGPTGRKLAAATVRKFHTVARSALQQAVKWEWLAVNPAANATPPKGKRKEPNPPKPEDLARLLAYTEERDPELFAYLRLSAVLGTRRGELLGIRWADFAEDCRSAEIRHSVVVSDHGIVVKKTKTDRVRRLALDAETARVVFEHRARCAERLAMAGLSVQVTAFVFSGETDGSKPWRPDSVSRRFSRMCKEIGLENVHLHDLRHYVATRLIAAGVDVRTVATRLGHASPSTTLNIYSAFVPEADRDAVDLLGDLLLPPKRSAEPPPRSRRTRSKESSDEPSVAAQGHNR